MLVLVALASLQLYCFRHSTEQKNLIDLSTTMELFNQQHKQRSQTEAPLAARMRPRTLEEFIGQEQIIGSGRLLRRTIEADQLASIIFFRPPGTGKTTLARIIANTTKAEFIAINAVLSGVKEIREAVSLAQERQKRHSGRTILFIDEVHRFNKSQQDALLPWIENGTVILIAGLRQKLSPNVSQTGDIRSKQITIEGKPVKKKKRHSSSEGFQSINKCIVPLTFTNPPESLFYLER